MREYLWARQVLGDEGLSAALSAASDPHRIVQILYAYRLLADPDLTARWREEERRLDALPPELKDRSAGRDAALCVAADPGTQARFAIGTRADGVDVDSGELRRLVLAVPGAEKAARKRLLGYLHVRARRKKKPGIVASVPGLGLVAVAVLGGCLLLPKLFPDRSSKRGPIRVERPSSDVRWIRVASPHHPDRCRVRFHFTGGYGLVPPFSSGYEAEQAIAADIARDPPSEPMTRRTKLRGWPVEYDVSPLSADTYEVRSVRRLKEP